MYFAAKMAKKKRNQELLNKKSASNKQGKSLYYWLGLSVVTLLTLITFWPSLYHDFTNWDDLSYVIDNEYIKILSWDNLVHIFTQPIATNYHPFTILSLALNYQAHQLTPFGYHATNLIFHLFNTLLVFIWGYQISQRKVLVAFLLALFFGIHPMHVSSVAWIAERKDVLYTFFFLLGLLSYQQYLAKEKTSWLLYTFLAFIASVFSKPSAVVFPLILLVIDYWQHRSWDKKLLLEKVPFFIVSLIFGLITIAVQKDTAIGSWQAYTLVERILFASYGFLTYIFKLIIPFPIVAYYPYPDVKEGLSFIYWISPFLVLLIWLLAIYTKKYTRILLVGLLFYTINIALVLQFVTVGEAIIANRYTYVSYIGLFLILAFAIDYLQHQFAKWKYLLGIGVISLCICWIALARNHIKVWKNSLTLWTHVIEHFSERAAIAYSNRANIYRENQQTTKALQDYNKALSIDEKYHVAYNNRAITYLNLQKYQQALADFTKSIELKPDYKILANRGTLYKKLGKREQALRDYAKSLQIKKNYEAYYGRGILYTEQSNTLLKGLEDIDRAIAIRPTYYFTYLIKGHIQRDNQRFEAAKVSYQKALQVISSEKERKVILQAIKRLPK